jgi:hypothetical protein
MQHPLLSAGFFALILMHFAANRSAAQEDASPAPRPQCGPRYQRDRHADTTHTIRSAPRIHLGPQPANTLVWFTFTLELREHACFRIYDRTGVQTATLLDTDLEAGTHIVWWNAAAVLPGTYAYRLQVGDAVCRGSVLVVR